MTAIYKCTKLLSVLMIIIIAFVFFCFGGVLAAPAKLGTNSTAIVAQTAKLFSETDFTPQLRQQLQAVRQRRNREVQKVLDSSQVAQFTQYLHSGNNFHQALEKLNLQGDRKEMVEAIVKICDLKLKAILSNLRGRPHTQR
ncbi:MAG: hypothetical protein N2235_10340 [Fischerella sp.]|nr:hypothetical protein [Fischerella sp.]